MHRVSQRLGPEAPARETERKTFVVLCASGFESVDRVRSALMFAALAASADFSVILYCIQGCVDVMVRGAVEKYERPIPGVPTIAQRLAEAMQSGVRIQCCSQSLANRGLGPADLVEGVQIAGAMTLIDIADGAAGTLSF
jgi:predicted peroxiredoxin